MPKYSCVVDRDPVFYHQAWSLIHSLILKGGVSANEIVANCTPGVDKDIQVELRKLGCVVRTIHPFGDGKYCNKIAQLEYSPFHNADFVFLLDCDMIVLEEINSLCKPGAISGKIVDFPNPKIELLEAMYRLAGFQDMPMVCMADCNPEPTFATNLNGGFYVIPGPFAKDLHARWSHWALFLLANIEMLNAAEKQAHVDQISFSMAVHELGISINQIERRFNYPAHDSIKNDEYPAVLHYHKCTNFDGLIVSHGENSKHYNQALRDANRIILKARSQTRHKLFLEERSAFAETASTSADQEHHH